MLAKTQGVNKLVVVINKMDDPTVNWSHERYLECTTKLSQFLKGTGYNLKTDVFFMPIAAQQTQGIKDRVPKDKCPWYDGPSLLEYLDSMQSLDRKVNAPFMMAVAGKYRDMGTMIEGKIEAGGMASHRHEASGCPDANSHDSCEEGHVPDHDAKQGAHRNCCRLWRDRR